MSKQIGFLVDGQVVSCEACYNPSAAHTASPLYDINILPYKQTCHFCGVVIQEGQTDSWPVLFEAKYKLGATCQLPSMGPPDSFYYGEPNECT